MPFKQHRVNKFCKVFGQSPPLNGEKGGGSPNSMFHSSNHQRDTETINGDLRASNPPPIPFFRVGLLGPIGLILPCLQAFTKVSVVKLAAQVKCSTFCMDRSFASPHWLKSPRLEKKKQKRPTPENATTVLSSYTCCLIPLQFKQVLITAKFGGPVSNKATKCHDSFRD